jgi:phosphomannomutase/phosphoglucomutase
MHSTTEIEESRFAKIWASAKMPLLAVAVILIVAVGGKFAYEFYVSWSLERHQGAVEHAGSQLLEQVVGVLSGELDPVRALRESPEVREALVTGDPGRLETQEDALTAAHPSLVGAELVAPGRRSVDSNESPPVGFALLEMLQSAEAEGKEPPLEVHFLGEEYQHIALVQPVFGADGAVVGYVRWAVRTDVFAKALRGARLGGGYATISQDIGKGMPLVLAEKGDSRMRKGVPDYSAKVPGTSWLVTFWSQREHESESSLDRQNLIMVGAGAAVLILLVTLSVARRRKRTRPRTAAAKRARTPTQTSVADNIKRRVEEAAQNGVDDGLDLSLDPTAGIVVEEEPDPEAEPEPTPRDVGENVDEEKKVQETKPMAGAQIPETIFRAYDVRGIVGETLSKDIVYDIGRAIGSEACDRQQQTVVVGCDGRLSGPELLEALIEGLRATGRDVIDIGRVPTPVLYFATHYLNTGSGVILTGSHNPPEYNGLKIMLAGETLFGEHIRALRQRIVDADFTVGEGNLQSMDVVPEYIRRVTEDVPVALGNAFSVVVDCGNGVAGDVAPKLIRALGHDVVELYCDVDGNFPNHHPDPSQPENLRDLIAAVKEHEADIGFAFDGDGDRLGVVDATGKIVWPDLQMMLYSRDIMSRNPGAEIVFDVKCSSRLAKVIKKLGGKPVMWKTGHSFIKNKMKESGALLAGEMSGHIFFKERWYGFDDALYAAARMLELLLGFKQPPSKIFAKLPSGITTPELRLDMSEGEPPALMERLVQTAGFEDAKITTIDGLRVDYPNSWGLVRASNTTPALIFRFEADDQEAMDEIQASFRKLLLAEKSDLALPF